MCDAIATDESRRRAHFGIADGLYHRGSTRLRRRERWGCPFALNGPFKELMTGSLKDGHIHVWFHLIIGPPVDRFDPLNDPIFLLLGNAMA